MEIYLIYSISILLKKIQSKKCLFNYVSKEIKVPIQSTRLQLFFTVKMVEKCHRNDVVILRARWSFWMKKVKFSQLTACLHQAIIYPHFITVIVSNCRISIIIISIICFHSGPLLF